MCKSLQGQNSPIFARVGIFNFFWFRSGKQAVFLLCFLLETGLLTDHSIASSKNPTDGKENVTLITCGKNRIMGSLNWNPLLPLLAGIHSCARAVWSLPCSPSCSSLLCTRAAPSQGTSSSRGWEMRSQLLGKEGQSHSQMSACGWRLLAEWGH